MCSAGICPSSASPRTTAPPPRSQEAWSLSGSVTCIVQKWSRDRSTLVLASAEVSDYSLTKLFAWALGPAQQNASDEDVKMAEDDERRGRSRAAVVLLNELISLKLPYSVSVVLNFLERKAVEEHKKRQR